MTGESLAVHFERYFSIGFAHSSELLEQAQRVRYDVYCREFHFEQEQNFPGGLEKDQYDEHSLHCLVTHRKTNLPAGCVRLVRIPRSNPELRLPLEDWCMHSLHHQIYHPDRFPRSSLAEISRLAVHTGFRRRRGEEETPVGSSLVIQDYGAATEELRVFPLISIALIAASASMIVLTQRQNLFIMIEAALAVLLRRMGLKFLQVGKTIDYHGRRTAHFITAEQVLQGMKGTLQDIFDGIHHRLEQESRTMLTDLSD